MLGTKALQIFDETTCVVRAVLRWTEFYKHESCGKCTPCREGTWWLVQILASGSSRAAASEADLEMLLDLCDNILGRSFCALGDGATSPITSSIQYFRDEYLAHLEHGGCPFDPASVRRSSQPRRPTHDDDTDERPTARPGDVEKSRRLVTLTIDGVEVIGAQGHAGDPRRRADRRRRSRGSATTRCSTRSAPAGSAWSRSPTPATAAAMPKPQASCTLDGRRRAWWSTPRPPRRSPTRRSRGSWSSC